MNKIEITLQLCPLQYYKSIFTICSAVFAMSSLDTGWVFFLLAFSFDGAGFGGVGFGVLLISINSLSISDTFCLICKKYTMIHNM